jgi:hypothetical protein
LGIYCNSYVSHTIDALGFGGVSKYENIFKTLHICLDKGNFLTMFNYIETNAPEKII